MLAVQTKLSVKRDTNSPVVSRSGTSLPFQPDNPLKNQVFNTTHLEASVIHFFADRVDKDPAYKKMLFKIIVLSRNNPELAIGAANAFTILVAAGVSFSGMNLKGISIPGANGRGSNLDGADLSSDNERKTNLDKVNFEKACLRNVNALNTSLQTVRFGEKAMLLGHTRPITGLTFLPNSTLLISSSEDGMIKVWDTAAGKLNYSYDLGQKYKVSRFAVHPSQPVIAILAENRGYGPHGETLFIWDISTDKKLVYEPKNNAKWEYTCLTFNGDGSQVLIAATYYPDERKKIGINLTGGMVVYSLDMASKKIVPFLSPLRNGIKEMVVSPDNRYLVMRRGNRMINVWDMTTGQRLRDIWDCNLIVDHLRFNPQGTYLAGACGEFILLWNTQTWQMSEILAGHVGHIKDMCFHPDGVTISSCGSDHSIRVMAINDAVSQPVQVSRLARWKALLSPQNWELFIRYGYIQPDGLSMAEQLPDEKTIPEQDNQLLEEACKAVDKVQEKISQEFLDFLSRISGGKVRQVFHQIEQTDRISVSPDGNLLVSGTDNLFGIRLWDLASQPFTDLRHGHTGAVKGIAITPDGMVISGGRDYMLRFWDLRTGRELRSQAIIPLKKHVGEDHISATSHWDSRTGIKRTIEVHEGGLDRLILSSSGRYLVIQGNEEGIQLHRLPDGKSRILGQITADYFANFKEEWEQLKHMVGEDETHLALTFGTPVQELGPEDFITQLRTKGYLLEDNTVNKELMKKHDDPRTLDFDAPFKPYIPYLLFKLQMSRRLLGSGKKIEDLAISGDDAFLAIRRDSFSSAVITILTLPAGLFCCEIRVKTKETYITTMEFHPKTNQLAVGCSNGKVYITNQIFEFGKNYVLDLNNLPEPQDEWEKRFKSYDNPILATVIDHGTIPTEKTVKKKGEQPYHPISKLAFSPSGLFLAALSDINTTLYIWRLADNSLVWQTPLEDEGIQSLRFLNDSFFLAVTEEGIRFIDIEEQLVLGRYPRMGDVSAFSYRNDGFYIATGSNDHSVKVWKLGGPKWNPFDLMTRWVSNPELDCSGMRYDEALVAEKDRELLAQKSNPEGYGKKQDMLEQINRQSVADIQESTAWMNQETEKKKKLLASSEEKKQ